MGGAIATGATATTELGSAVGDEAGQTSGYG